MNERIPDLAPSRLWRYFFQLSAIPRPSRHEQQVREFLLGCGKSLGLEARADRVGNVIIRKGATAGMERAVPVILQGHMDMVPQANADTPHDFIRQPIEPVLDGGWVAARGTTLGADNGIGVAAMLAILASGDLPHGPLEALFTCNEESGMDGAFGLAAGELQGSILINTDAEDEGVLCIGCAGGVNVNSRMRYRPEMPAGDWTFYRIGVTGLKGGHSGVDIHRGRGNAIVLLFRLLQQLIDECGLRLSDVDAGNLRNAIPREAFATVAVPATNGEDLSSILVRMEGIFLVELGEADPDLRVAGEALGRPPQAWIPERIGQRLVHAVRACPNGVIRMSDTIPELVESSTNLAIVRSENGQIEVASLVRSSLDTARDDICGRLRSLFTLVGAETVFDGAYPGWKSDDTSPILHLTRRIYLDRFGIPVRTGAIHAGLECGILGATYPDLDMISFGPTIRYPHSPAERVEISSVGRFWELLVGVLAGVEDPALLNNGAG